MTENYQVRALNDSNLSDYAELFKNVFDYQPSLDEIKNKFMSLTRGLQQIGYLAYSEQNQVAAYYGVFPLEVDIAGKKIVCAQSGSTMTHPSHRNKGIFKLLAQKTYEECKNKDVHFVFGMPNQFSKKGLESLGWKFLYKMISVKIPLPTINFMRYLTLPKVTDYFKQPIKLNNFIFFKPASDNEIKNLSNWAESINEHSSQIIRFKNIYILFKVSSSYECRIGDLYFSDDTSKMTQLLTLFLLTVEMTLNNMALISFHSRPNNNKLSFFKFLSIKRFSLLFGYFNISGLYSDSDIKQMEFNYKDYDTY